MYGFIPLFESLSRPVFGFLLYSFISDSSLDVTLNRQSTTCVAFPVSRNWKRGWPVAGVRTSLNRFGPHSLSNLFAAQSFISQAEQAGPACR